MLEHEDGRLCQQTGQGQSSNTPATGGPGITGTVGAGETLTATTDLIEDEDGLTGAVFAYQWLVDGAEITALRTPPTS